MSKEGYVT